MSRLPQQQTTIHNRVHEPVTQVLSAFDKCSQLHAAEATCYRPSTFQASAAGTPLGPRRHCEPRLMSHPQVAAGDWPRRLLSEHRAVALAQGKAQDSKPSHLARCKNRSRTLRKVAAVVSAGCRGGGG